MKRLIVICGPTAVGKTGLALKFCSEFGGEIISADSRQVYRGMDIGTGKDLPRNSEFRIKNAELEIARDKFTVGYYNFGDVPVWLLDVVTPDQLFNVADYCSLAQKFIGDIWQRGKIPFLTGGTGFYIKALLEGVESLGIEPDWELRERLQNYSVMELQKILKETGPERMQGMNESDKKNPRRLIRAIEISTKTQKSCLAGQQAKLKTDKLLMIGLTAPLKVLYQRIDERVDDRIRMGAEREVKSLLSSGYSWDLPAMSSYGYCEWQPYFEGKQSLKEVVQRWKYNEHGYARRQMTWFRKVKAIKWFDTTQKNFDKEIEKIIQSFLSG